jgi:lysylphosphatidylglycerol synthetase-like protein (DUF2156 family)
MPNSTLSTDSSLSKKSALDVIRAYTDNPSAFLALNNGNEYFRAPGVPGFIAYRACGDYLVQFGGPFAPPEARGALLAAFAQHAGDRERSVVAVQVQQDDVDRYASGGFTVNQVGASYAVDLGRFRLDGTRFMQLRNKISRARRAGLTVREVDLADWSGQVAQVDKAWLAAKGEHAKPLEFLVGECGGEMQEYRRLFLGLVGGEPVAYISYAPAYGAMSGWLHDLSRRVPAAPPGTMEAVNAAALAAFTAEEAGWLHFGFTPFAGLDGALQGPNASPGFGILLGWMYQNAAMVYPAQTQLAYKQKWAPHAVLPEYAAFHGAASLAAFIHVFKAANAI